MAKQHPLARKAGLASETVQDEMLVYDLDRHKAFCLNQTAAQVWKHCDGRTSVPQIAKSLKADEKLVWYALDQLGRDRLLQDKIALPATLAGMTRRQHLRALGKAAAVAVPLVTAVMAPTASAQASCIPVDGTCTSTPQCCAGLTCCNIGGFKCRTPGACV